MKPRLSFELFAQALSDRNDIRCREMYRELIHDLSLAEDAAKVMSSKPKPFTAFQPELNPEEFPTYAMTAGGRLWKYNCGWHPIDKSGKIIGPPIGHTAFRKKPLVKRTDTWIRVAKPDGPWRRYIDTPMNHPLYGNGIILATDGVHAVFQFHTLEGDTKKTEVAFQNLVEAHTIAPVKSVKSVNKTTPREKKLSNHLLELLDLD